MDEPCEENPANIYKILKENSTTMKETSTEYTAAKIRPSNPLAIWPISEFSADNPTTNDQETSTKRKNMIAELPFRYKPPKITTVRSSATNGMHCSKPMQRSNMVDLINMLQKKGNAITIDHLDVDGGRQLLYLPSGARWQISADQQSNGIGNQCYGYAQSSNIIQTGNDLVYAAENGGLNDDSVDNYDSNAADQDNPESSKGHSVENDQINSFSFLQKQATATCNRQTKVIRCAESNATGPSKFHCSKLFSKSKIVNLISMLQQMANAAADGQTIPICHLDGSSQPNLPGTSWCPSSDQQTNGVGNQSHGTTQSANGGFNYMGGHPEYVNGAEGADRNNGGGSGGTVENDADEYQQVLIYRYVLGQQMHLDLEEVIEAILLISNAQNWNDFAQHILLHWQERNFGNMDYPGAEINPDNCWPGAATIPGYLFNGRFESLNWRSCDWEPFGWLVNCLIVIENHQD